MAGREIILASQSPRRRELLSKMGYEFICDAADVDEHVQGQAREIVGILARRKAHAVLARHKTGVIIASDTLVSLDGAPLGKPGDEAEAVRMLRALSGREHEVFSGVCLLNAATGREQVERHGFGRGVRSVAPVEDHLHIDRIRVVVAQFLMFAGCRGGQNSGGRCRMEYLFHRLPPFRLKLPLPISHTSETSAFVGPNQCRCFVACHT